jgi:anti-sigma-K factor RskA
MIDDRKEELAALAALGLLEGAEREQFLAEIARDPELKALAAELLQAASGLAHVAPEAEPPAALKARILASAAGRPNAGASRESAAARRGVPPTTPFPSWIPWLMAACVTLAALWTHRQYVSVRAENAVLAEQQRIAQVALDQTKGELAEAKRLVTESSLKVAELSTKLKDEGDLAHLKISMLASMLGNTPAAVAVAVWDPSREQGVLSVSKLPALASEKDYQLWLVDPQYPSPVNGGVFVVDPVTGEAHIVFKGDKHVGSIAKFAVSLERKGGVPVREGPIVLLSQ